MPTPHYRVEPNGFLPLHCFQCQAASCHQVDRVHTRLPRLFRRDDEAQFGFVARCDRCGLSSPIDPDTASVCLESPPSLLEESASELFGEDNEVDYWKVQHEQVRLGIASPEDRANAIGVVYEAVSEHARLPKFIRKPSFVHEPIFQIVVWAIGAIAAFIVSMLLTKSTGYWTGVFISTIGMIVAWSIVCAFAFRDGTGVKPEEVRAERRDMTKRLAEGLSEIDPTGYELKRIQEVAMRHGMWSGITDPHQVLIQINALKKSKRDSSVAA